ncbi:MAG: hypothetical protein AB8B99_18430 [Phormidesmis sp.]
MQNLFFQNSRNLLLGLSLVGILCSCAGTSSSSYDSYYPESDASDSYADIESGSSQPYIEDDVVIQEDVPTAIPYEDGELALTEDELRLLEAIQAEAAQANQSPSYPSSNYYTDSTSSGSYSNPEWEAYRDEAMADIESDIRAFPQQRADSVSEGASYP